MQRDLKSFQQAIVGVKHEEEYYTQQSPVNWSVAVSSPEYNNQVSWNGAHLITSLAHDLKLTSVSTGCNSLIEQSNTELKLLIPESTQSATLFVSITPKTPLFVSVINLAQPNGTVYSIRVRRYTDYEHPFTYTESVSTQYTTAELIFNSAVAAGIKCRVHVNTHYLSIVKTFTPLLKVTQSVFFLKQVTRILRVGVLLDLLAFKTGTVLVGQKKEASRIRTASQIKLFERFQTFKIDPALVGVEADDLTSYNLTCTIKSTSAFKQIQVSEISSMH